MFITRLYVKAKSGDEAVKVAEKTVISMGQLVEKFVVSYIEKYDETSDEEYQIKIDINTFEKINQEKAKNIVERIGDVWEWDKDSASCLGNEAVGTKFKIDEIFFAVFWFEDLEYVE